MAVVVVVAALQHVRDAVVVPMLVRAAKVDVMVVQGTVAIHVAVDAKGLVLLTVVGAILTVKVAKAVVV